MSQSPFLAYAGLHIKTCPLAVREPLSKLTNWSFIQEVFPGTEFVLISTCNRFDILFLTSISYEFIYEGFYKLILSVIEEQDYSFLENLESYLRVYFDREGLIALLQVASSLDSMVVGETQIFNQVKSAFFRALSEKFCSPKVYDLLNHCFKTVKKVRHQTSIGQKPVSIGHAAVDWLRKQVQDRKLKKCLILGSGEMAKSTVRYFISIFPQVHMTIASRTFENAEKMAKSFRFPEPIEMNKALDTLGEFDVIFCAMAGNEILIHKSDIKPNVGAFFIDMSMPRKLDSAMRFLPSVTLIDLDDLNRITSSSLALRLEEAKKAQVIIEGEVESYLRHKEKRERLKSLGKLHEWIHQVVLEESERYFREKKLGKKTPLSQLATSASKKIVSKFAEAMSEAQDKGQILAQELLSREEEVYPSLADSTRDVLESLFSPKTLTTEKRLRRVRPLLKQNYLESTLSISEPFSPSFDMTKRQGGFKHQKDVQSHQEDMSEV